MNAKHLLTAIVAAGAVVPVWAAPTNTFTMTSQRTYPWGAITPDLPSSVWSGQTRVWNPPASSMGGASTTLGGSSAAMFSGSSLSRGGSAGLQSLASGYSPLRLTAPDPTKAVTSHVGSAHITRYKADAYGGVASPVAAGVEDSISVETVGYDRDFYRYARVADGSGNLLSEARAVAAHASSASSTHYSLDTRIAVSAAVDPDLGRTAAASARTVDVAYFYVEREVSVEMAFNYAASRQVGFDFEVYNRVTNHSVLRISHADLFPLGGVGLYERTYAATLGPGTYEIYTNSWTDVAANNKHTTNFGGESEVSIDIDWHEVLVDANDYFADLQAALPAELWAWVSLEPQVTLLSAPAALVPALASASDDRVYGDGNGGWSLPTLEILLEGEEFSFDRTTRSRVSVIEEIMARLYGQGWQGGIDGDALAAFYATVPEPTSLALAGIAAAALLRRRRA